VIPKKWVIHIFQPPFDDAFHDLEQKRLVLGVNILNTLQQNSKQVF
jgi:hypothetical protein